MQVFSSVYLCLHCGERKNLRSQSWISSRNQFCVKASHLFVTLFTSLGNIVIIFIRQTYHYMKLYALRASLYIPRATRDNINLDSGMAL